MANYPIVKIPHRIESAINAKDFFINPPEKPLKPIEDTPSLAILFVPSLLTVFIIMLSIDSGGKDVLGMLPLFALIPILSYLFFLDLSIKSIKINTL